MKQVDIYVTPTTSNWNFCITVFKGAYYPSDIGSRLNNVLYSNGILPQKVELRFIWEDDSDQEYIGAYGSTIYNWNGITAEELEPDYPEWDACPAFASEADFWQYIGMPY